MQGVYVALGAVALEVADPPGEVASAAALRNQLGDAVATATRAPRALDDEHVELSFDVAKHEVVSSHCASAPARRR
jgi:hypothetical protein